MSEVPSDWSCNRQVAGAVPGVTITLSNAGLVLDQLLEASRGGRLERTYQRALTFDFLLEHEVWCCPESKECAMVPCLESVTSGLRHA